jgi:hypothetical protein
VATIVSENPYETLVPNWTVLVAISSVVKEISAVDVAVDVASVSITGAEISGTAVVVKV